MSGWVAAVAFSLAMVASIPFYALYLIQRNRQKRRQGRWRNLERPFVAPYPQWPQRIEDLPTSQEQTV